MTFPRKYCLVATANRRRIVRDFSGHKLARPAAAMAFGNTAAAKEFPLNPVPTDSISSLAFSPAPYNMLACGSWDNSVRIFDVDSNGYAAGLGATVGCPPPCRRPLLTAYAGRQRVQG